MTDVPLPAVLAAVVTRRPAADDLPACPYCARAALNLAAWRAGSDAQITAAQIRAAERTMP